MNRRSLLACCAAALSAAMFGLRVKPNVAPEGMWIGEGRVKPIVSLTWRIVDGKALETVEYLEFWELEARQRDYQSRVTHDG